MSTPALVTVAGLGVHYPSRDTPALSGIDLDVGDGEQVLVMGPSGSGKSTLLHALCGVVPTSLDADVEGSVRVAGHDVPATPIPVLSRTVGLLGQDPTAQVCLPRVDDELAFVLENRCTPPEEIGPRVAEILEVLGLAHLATRRTGTLSGGELQRVALAATLLARPRLLLLDEPTAMLDPAAAREVARLVAAGAVARGTTTIMVEHRLEDLERLPQRLLVLDAGGRVVADGPTAEVFAAHGPWLARTGSWLPLAIELDLALDRPSDPCQVPTPTGALSRPGTERAIRHLAGGARARRPRQHAAPEVLRAEGLTAASGDTVLIRDVDLALRGGELTAVVGPNGGGKTSLLLALAGLLPPVSGRLVGGPVGMVFQHPEHQFVGRTVAQDIGHGLGVHDSAADDRVRDALVRFGLVGVADADPYRLSGGQQRRLSVAAMAVLDQPVLLLDEPTFGQDRASAAALADHLRTLADDGVAVVIATHDLRLAARIADRLLLVAEGTVRGCATPEQILRDAALLAEAGLHLPPLLAWWAAPGRDVGLRGLLSALHERAPEPTVAS